MHIDKSVAYQSYLDNPKTTEMAMDAILRNLAIIGEAVNHLPQDLYTQHPEINWRAIVGLRNVLVHQYFAVTTEDIAESLENDLAELKAVIEEEQNLGKHL